MKNLRLLLLVSISLLSLSPKASAQNPEQRYYELSTQATLMIGALSVGYVECDITQKDMSINTCLKGIRTLLDVNQSFKKLQAKRVILSVFSVEITQNATVYLDVNASSEKMRKILTTSENTDYASVKKELDVKINDLIQNSNAENLTIGCLNWYEPGTHWNQTKNPKKFPLYIKDCLKGVENLEDAQYLSEVNQYDDIIFTKNFSGWTQFGDEEFEYFLHYEMNPKAMDWLAQIKTLKTRFFSAAQIMLQNFNLPSNLEVDCFFSGSIDWCFESLDLVSDFHYDLSGTGITHLHMSAFDLHCWEYEEDGEKHVSIPNGYTHDQLRAALDKCYKK
ncbi:MAG: hypothetical protein ACPGJV_14890 [Bacteriovoracaceae bacterium]